MSNQTKKLNTYTSEFKESAVKLALESDQPKTTVDRTDEHIYDEVKRLKKELAKVTQERDLLKKATAYFAKEIL